MAPKKLPPKGGTTANKPRAVTQRVSTAVRQRVQQDTATLRALQDNMRRNVERDARQIPADPAPRVRRVGPGGANPKPQNRLSPGAKPAQLPPGNRGGAVTPAGSSAVTKPTNGRGGALAVRDSNGQRALPPSGGGNSRALPPGQRGGAVKPVNVTDLGNTKPANPWGSATRPPATPYNGPRGTALPGGGPAPKPNAAPPKPNTAATGAIGKAAKGLTGLKGGLASLAIGAIANPLVDQLGQAGGRALGNALKPIGRAIDDRLPGVNSKDEARRIAAGKPLPQMTAAEREKAVRLTQATPEQAKPKPNNKPKPTTTPPTSTQRASRGSTATSSAPAPTSRRSSSVPTPSKSGDTTPPGVPAKDSYRDGGKGLYQGSQAYRDSMKAKDANSSGNPLLDNNRKIGKSQATSSSATSAPGGIGPTVSDQQLNQMRIKKDQEKKRVRRRNEY